MNKKIAIIVVVALLLCVGVVGAVLIWVQKNAASAAAPQAVQMDASQLSYVTLEKVVVMIDSSPVRGRNQYLSVDLVLRTDKVHEKTAKSDLPMLKGVAVRSISKIGVEQARAMDIDAWTSLLQRDLMDAYPDEQAAKRPFDQVLVSRLIIE